MKTTTFSTMKHLFVWFAASALPSVSYAEIYKWVDASGRTHYSERKSDAERATKVVTQSAPQSADSTATTSPSEYWQDQERLFRQRQIRIGTEERRVEARRAKKPKALSDGTEDGTDASRCNLARDVISGAVRHGNGKPTDQYDIEIARNDIRMFCR